MSSAIPLSFHPEFREVIVSLRVCHPQFDIGGMQRDVKRPDGVYTHSEYMLTATLGEITTGSDWWRTPEEAREKLEQAMGVRK